MSLRSDDVVWAAMASEGDGEGGIADGVEANGRVTVFVILMVDVVPPAGSFCLPDCLPVHCYFFGGERALKENRRACFFAACEEGSQVAVR